MSYSQWTGGVTSIEGTGTIGKYYIDCSKTEISGTSKKLIRSTNNTLGYKTGSSNYFCVSNTSEDIDIDAYIVFELPGYDPDDYTPGSEPKVWLKITETIADEDGDLTAVTTSVYDNTGTMSSETGDILLSSLADRGVFCIPVDFSTCAYKAYSYTLYGGHNCTANMNVTLNVYVISEAPSTVPVLLAAQDNTTGKYAGFDFSGSGLGTTAAYSVGDTVNVPDVRTATKGGTTYKSAFWYWVDEGEEKYWDFDVDTVPAGGVTLYPGWVNAASWNVVVNAEVTQMNWNYHYSSTDYFSNGEQFIAPGLHIKAGDVLRFAVDGVLAPISSIYESTAFITSTGAPTNAVFVRDTFNGSPIDGWADVFFNANAAHDLTSVEVKNYLAKHTVTFVTNGGTELEPLDVHHGATLTDTDGYTEPEKTGYALVGWYTDSSLETAWDMTAGVTADITLYARWGIEVKLDLTGGQWAIGYAPAGYALTDGVWKQIFDEDTALSDVCPDVDPSKEPSGDVRYIFKGWYTASTGGTIVSFSGTLTSAITAYAQWQEYGNDVKDMYVRIGAVIQTGTAIQADGQNAMKECVFEDVPAGAKIYVYNTWDSRDPCKIRNVYGPDVEKVSGKPYVLVDEAGTYLLQVRQATTLQANSEYDVIGARYDQGGLTSGTKYLYRAYAGATTPFATVGYLESSGSAGEATIVTTTAADELVWVAQSTAGFMNVYNVAHSGADTKVLGSMTVDASSSAYGYIDGTYAGSKAVRIRTAGTYRVYIRPGTTTLEIDPVDSATTAPSDATEAGYYAVGSFTNFEVMAAYKLETTDIEGVLSTGSAVGDNGDVYRIAKVEMSGGIKVIDYIALGDGDTKKLCATSGGVTLYVDSWNSDSVTFEQLDVYRIIVESFLDTVSLKYRSNVYDADVELSGLTFVDTPDDTPGKFADIAGSTTIASLTVIDGYEVNAISVGATFAYAPGYSYRLKLDPGTYNTSAPSPVNESWIGYLIGDVKSLGISWGTFTTGSLRQSSKTGSAPYVYEFADVLLSEGDKFKLCYPGDNTDYRSEHYHLTAAQLAEGFFTNAESGGDITVQRAGVYTLRLTQDAWDYDTGLISYTFRPLTNTLTYADGTTFNVAYLGNNIIYNTGSDYEKIALNSSGDNLARTVYTYTDGTLPTGAQTIPNGAEFMVYVAGTPQYHAISEANGRVTNVAAKHFMYKLYEGVAGSGRFEFTVSASAIYANFVGGAACLTSSLSVGSSTSETTGWFAVGTFSKWSVYADNRLRSTQIYGVFGFNVAFGLSGDVYKAAYVNVSGGKVMSIAYYDKNGATDTSGAESDIPLPADKKVFVDTMKINWSTSDGSNITSAGSDMHAKTGDFTGVTRYVFNDEWNKRENNGYYATPGIYIWSPGSANEYEMKYNRNTEYYYDYTGDPCKMLIIKPRSSWNVWENQSCDITLTGYSTTAANARNKSYYVSSKDNTYFDGTAKNLDPYTGSGVISI